MTFIQMRIFPGILALLLLISPESRGQSWQERDESRSDVRLEVFQKKLPDENVRKIHGRTCFNPHPGIANTSFSKQVSYPTGWCTPEQVLLKRV